MKAWLLLPLLVALAFPAEAAPLKLGKAGYGGPGCPGGSASVAATSTNISIRFDRYQVAAGGSTGKSFDRKACSMSIPITVPAGKSVAIVGLNFAGYTKLPTGATADFRVEQFLVGGKGPVFTRSVKGPKTGKFTASSDTALSWSACGGGTTFRVNTSLIVRTTGGKAASASIRAQDVSTAVVYRLKFKDC